MGKKKANSKEAWLDWLRDEPPAASAQEELRERFKQQANSYKPLDRSRPVAPAVPQPNVATHPSGQQLQAASNTTSAAQQAREPGNASKATAPATVSIQIHLPSFQFKRVRRLVAAIKHGVRTISQWLGQQYSENSRRFIGVGVAVAVILIGVFVPPLLADKQPKTAGGAASSANAGADAGYDKPPFTVIYPSSKPKLATPDGVRAAYDGAKNSYSFSDTMAGNGFTVSQQPIPPQFADGQTAVDSIAPTLNKGVTPVSLKSITGPAYLSTNPKYDSQTVVASIRNLLIFIQSAHAFKPAEWENYLNTLQ